MPVKSSSWTQFALTTLLPNIATNYIPKNINVTGDNHPVSMANITVHYSRLPVCEVSQNFTADLSMAYFG